MTTEQIFVGLGADVLNHVTDAEHQLIFDGRHPRVVVQLEDRPGAQEVEGADLGREDREAVALEVELAEVLELADLLRDAGQLVVAEGEDPQVGQIADVRRKLLEVVVAGKKWWVSPESSDSYNIVFGTFIWSLSFE